jgi:hypothetical protein
MITKLVAPFYFSSWLTFLCNSVWFNIEITITYHIILVCVPETSFCVPETSFTLLADSSDSSRTIFSWAMFPNTNRATEVRKQKKNQHKRSRIMPVENISNGCWIGCYYSRTELNYKYIEFIKKKKKGIKLVIIIKKIELN